MVIPEGYKTTEAGIIPVDWDAVPLLNICNLINGLTYHPENVKEFGLLVMRSSNVQNNRFSFKDNVYVNVTVPDEQLIKKDDILVCVRNGSSELIGKCAKAEKNYPITFGAFMAVLRGSYNDLVFQLFLQGDIQKKIRKNSNTAINQITNGDFSKVFVPFPRLESEYHNIVKPLSEIDVLIDNLVKLLAKKKNIKQGAMQELLTGKRRLPGFKGKWETKRIMDYGFLQKVTVNPQLFSNDVFVEYSMPAFDNNRKPFIKYGSEMHSNRLLISGNVLLFNKLNVRQKRIWFVNANKHNSVCSSEFLPFVSETIELVFLSYLLHSESITKDFIEKSTGTSNSQQRITPETFLEYRICVPKTKDEQIAIASILSDMDSEIDELEKKLVKYRNIKKGMMSELLTGHIRLTDKEGA